MVLSSIISINIWLITVCFCISIYAVIRGFGKTQPQIPDLWQFSNYQWLSHWRGSQYLNNKAFQTLRELVVYWGHMIPLSRLLWVDGIYNRYSFCFLLFMDWYIYFIGISAAVPDVYLTFTWWLPDKYMMFYIIFESKLLILIDNLWTNARGNGEMGHIQNGCSSAECIEHLY